MGRWRRSGWQLVPLSLSLGGCRESVGTDSPPAVDGAYVLQSVGGRPLPLVVLETAGGITFTLLSDTLVLKQGVSWEIPVSRRYLPGVYDSLISAGRVAPRPFDRRGDSLFFRDVGSGTDTATVRTDGILSAVSRFPPSGCATPCRLIFRRP